MEQPIYKRRGSKTFIAILIIRLIPAVIFLFAVIFLAGFRSTLEGSIVKLTGSAAPIIMQGYGFIVSVGFLLFVLLVALLILIAWLEYISFRYMLDEDAFRTKTGIFNIQEMAILYRQIQNVDIDRPLVYRLIGMSRIAILTAGQEDHNRPEEHDESEGIIDLIDKDQADMIQRELLDRSNVQVVKEESPTTLPHMY